MKIIYVLILCLFFSDAYALPQERFLGYAPVVEREFQIDLNDCLKSYFSVGTDSDKIWKCQSIFPITGKLRSVESLNVGNSFSVDLPVSSFDSLGQVLKAPTIFLTVVASGYEIAFRENQFTVLGPAPDLSDVDVVRSFLEAAAAKLPARVTAIIEDEVTNTCK